MVESLSERPSGVACGRLQSLEDLLALFLAAQRADKDAGMPQVRRNLDVRDGHQPNARIVNLALKDLAEFDSELLFNAIDASALHNLSLYNLDITLNDTLRRASFGLLKR